MGTHKWHNVDHLVHAPRETDELAFLHMGLYADSHSIPKDFYRKSWEHGV